MIGSNNFGVVVKAKAADSHVSLQTSSVGKLFPCSRGHPQNGRQRRWIALKVYRTSSWQNDTSANESRPPHPT